MFYRDAFSLSELCDVAWALLRLKSGNAPATRAGLLGDDRLFALFKRVEDLVLSDATALKHAAAPSAVARASPTWRIPCPSPTTPRAGPCRRSQAV